MVEDGFDHIYISEMNNDIEEKAIKELIKFYRIIEFIQVEDYQIRN